MPPSPDRSTRNTLILSAHAAGATIPQIAASLELDPNARPCPGSPAGPSRRRPGLARRGAQDTTAIDPRTRSPFEGEAANFWPVAPRRIRCILTLRATRRRRESDWRRARA